MNFNLVKLVITVQADDPFLLSQRLPLLGNEYSTVCRKNSCLRQEKPCNSCLLKETCSWNLVFAQQLSNDPSAVKRFQKPALPFIFTFPSPHDLDGSQAETECSLVVMGQAIACIDMLLDGFRDILLSFDAEVLRIGSQDYQGNVHLLDEGIRHNRPENMIVLSSNDLVDNFVMPNSDLQIRLLSPLRLFEDGHFVGRFDFSRFARSLLRRVSSMAYYYGAYEFTCDYKELSRQADAVVCVDENFTLVANKDLRIKGIMGHGSFQGDLCGLLPFLIVGEYVHVGKGSTFGMGAYEVR